MPHQGNATGNRRSNSKTPIGVLVESQNLAREGHAKSHEQEKHAHNPGQFTGVLVCAKQKDLNHMYENNRYHEVRAPPVKGSNVPAERNVVIQDLKAAPGFCGGGYVNEGQHDAGNDLQHERDEGGTAENIKPTGGFARNGMLRSLTDGGAKLKTRVQPIADRSDQAHGRISRTILEACPGVGSSPALINSFAPSIL